MTQTDKRFDRMIRIDPELHAKVAIVARFEELAIKDFVAQALKEAIDRRQIKIVDALAELNAAVKAATAK